ncbi:MAG: ATP synthase F1 subunit delta [Oscillospiraceae bacterium]|nr:ATP synthase F1 subunit delta [Oscillospiraceae bacterium]
MSLAVRRYSEALLDIAFEEKCEEEVYEQFRLFYEQMKADKQFERLMTEKILSSEELKATVSKILDGGNTFLISFLMTLIDRNRMEEVMEMFLDFERGYKEKKNILEAEAVTAVEMTEEQIAEVKKALGEKYGKKIVLKTSVDPSIIGGMVLYIGNDMLDASVKAKFEGLKKQLKSIQIS